MEEVRPMLKHDNRKWMLAAFWTGILMMALLLSYNL